MLFNEPKLLKSTVAFGNGRDAFSFSALQRAEIAEIAVFALTTQKRSSFSALQRAEIAEIRANETRSAVRS